LGECLVYFRSDKGELSEMLLPDSLYWLKKETWIIRNEWWMLEIINIWLKIKYFILISLKYLQLIKAKIIAYNYVHI
jgi:ABC-type sugar transport system permease subunit